MKTSSLTDLKHLSHLDLRFNNFEGIPLPKFTVSLHMLHYLDLSHAKFSGMIHDEIGNLSNLYYPDISGVLTSLWVRDVSWLSALSSLQYLDIGSVNITSTSHELFLAVNMIPYLLELVTFVFLQSSYSPSIYSI